MAQGVTATGITPSQREEGTTERKLHAKVVDSILNSAVYFSRLMSMGVPFSGKTFDVTLKITDSGLGEFFTGLETLNSAAVDTTIQLSWAHTAFSQPIVLPLLESMANTGPEATIDLDTFKYEEAIGEAVQKLSSAAFSTGTGDRPMGLGGHIDDGTDVGTYGGQTRSSYDPLDANRTASGGTMTLAKLATLDDDCSAPGVETEAPNINLTTKSIWSNFEELLQPTVRAEYASVGYPALGVRAPDMVKTRGDLKGGAGFTALTYRGNPVIKDGGATAQNWWMINERYIQWAGRTIVPEKFRGMIEKVNLGSMKTMEGTAAALPPSKYHGWFSQKLQMMPNQAGAIARYYVIGQIIGRQPRRQGRLTGITGV
jgi:hypothetical protein